MFFVCTLNNCEVNACLTGLILFDTGVLRPLRYDAQCSKQKRITLLLYTAPIFFVSSEVIPQFSCIEFKPQNGAKHNTPVENLDRSSAKERCVGFIDASLCN